MNPVLAVKDRSAELMSDVQEMGYFFERVSHKINLFEPMKGRDTFWWKKSAWESNGLNCFFIASSGVNFEIEDTNGCDFFIPIEGFHNDLIGGKFYQQSAGESGFFTNIETRRTTFAGSGVLIQLENKSFNHIASSMLNRVCQFDLLETQHKIPLTMKDTSFCDSFKLIFSQIDRFSGDPAFLNRLSLDSTIYRLICCTLMPHLFLADESEFPRQRARSRKIDKVCAILREKLNEPVSLSQMEKLSELSARSLQRSFQRAFNMSPQEWLRQQRLHAARSILSKAHEPIHITSLAYDLCFPSPSAFAMFYKKEFGESPSETLKRRGF